MRQAFVHDPPSVLLAGACPLGKVWLARLLARVLGVQVRPLRCTARGSFSGPAMAAGDWAGWTGQPGTPVRLDELLPPRAGQGGIWVTASPPAMLGDLVGRFDVVVWLAQHPQTLAHDAWLLRHPDAAELPILDAAAVAGATACWKHRAAEWLLDPLPAGAQLLRLEDLLADPRREIGGLFARLGMTLPAGLDCSPAAWLGTIPGRQRLTPEQHRQVLEATSALLPALGYGEDGGVHAVPGSVRIPESLWPEHDRLVRRFDRVCFRNREVLSGPGITIAHVPARSGSRRLAHKNVRLLGGHPLLAWSVELARELREAGGVDRIILDTDSPAYAALGRACGAETPYLRPPEFSDAQASPFAAVVHLLEHFVGRGIRVARLVSLYPTSPFREPSRMAVLLDELSRHAQVQTVQRIAHRPEGPARCLTLDDGGLAKPTGHFVGLNLLCHPLADSAPHLAWIDDPAQLVDIDTPPDWAAAENVLARGLAPWTPSAPPLPARAAAAA